MNETIAKADQGAIATQGFSEQSLAVTGETMATSLAARETAKIQARYTVAMAHRRNWEVIRSEILAACKRPNFANVAWFSLPFGEKVEGFSVKFSDEAARTMGHIHMQTSITVENDTERHVLVEVTDLQNNLEIDTTVVIKKTVEKKFPKKGETAISVRTNSSGGQTYLYEATDADIDKKQNSAISKAYRNAVLRFMPGDIKDECKYTILKIRDGEILEDPIAFRRKIIDSFGEVGVNPKDLEWFLDHTIDSSSPAELKTMRDLYAEIRDGNTTWAQVQRAIKDERNEPDEPAKKPMDKFKDKLKKGES